MLGWVTLTYGSAVAANMRDPKPVDPLWYRPHLSLRVRCGCGRCVWVRPRDAAMRAGYSDELKIHEVLSRLACRECGRRQPEVVGAGR